MRKETFLTQFLFNNTASLMPSQKPPFVLGKNLTRAAVLIPIIEQNDQLEVILTLRASHLKHHAGQISFPGGKVEEYDINEIATALRETQEEIGVSENNITVVGTLPTYHTATGYHITPVLGFIDPPCQYCLNTNEVAEIFHVPLNHFLNSNNHIALNLYHNLTTHSVYFMPYKHYNIWGVTASILKKLAEQLQP
ncbi:CoA pyrophosphatase [Thalassotalea profundi]|uniref:Coenzyme A pyrophosphatase n=1 Tax=Thalassotalea profundi TaxID=2036687 RepID=A0ABQ3IJG9_9GAMM|nr:CoA pyrophosphatase [Thalassotalea profundi]GHE85521.1 coenzyme A pyrophosphatase [Thalassotalea profundi]